MLSRRKSECCAIAANQSCKALVKLISKAVHMEPVAAFRANRCLGRTRKSEREGDKCDPPTEPPTGHTLTVSSGNCLGACVHVCVIGVFRREGTSVWPLPVFLSGKMQQCFFNIPGSTFTVTAREGNNGGGGTHTTWVETYKWSGKAAPLFRVLL